MIPDSEVTMKREKVWIRIGGNAKHIKDGGEYGWRCFVSDTPIRVFHADKEILLKRVAVDGLAVGGKNFIFDHSPESPVLVAWVDMFGNITVQDDVARIELLPQK